MRASTLRTLALAMICLAPVAALAQPGPDDSYFPTPSVTDSRSLEISCGEGLVTLTEQISVRVAVPAGQATFDLHIFDGETGVESACNPRNFTLPPSGFCNHWDGRDVRGDAALGRRQLFYRLCADPNATLDTSSCTSGIAEAELFGNDDGMPDNAWFSASIPVSAAAKNVNGYAYYHLLIGFDADPPLNPNYDGLLGCDPAGFDPPGPPGPFPFAETTANTFKLAVSAPATFDIPGVFGFDGAIGFTPKVPGVLGDDTFIVYPTLDAASPLGDPDLFLNLPVTYDGTWQFFVDVGPDADEVRFFDGDWDHGNVGVDAPPLPNTFPSNRPQVACFDLDDPDTPFNYLGFDSFFDVGLAIPEAGALVGSPPDDNLLDLFRRGELGSFERFGCPRYEVFAPNGAVYASPNASGNQEWEQLRISADAACDDSPTCNPVLSPNCADVCVPGPIPGGIWEMRATGLDHSNLDFWVGACAVREEPFEPGPFDCRDAKPIDGLTMVWNGTQNVDIIAYDGDAGGTELATILNVMPSDEVTVLGMDGGPNDQQWEIYEAGTSNLLGVSEFHISCSDDEMDGPEDCGMPQGNGKGNDSDLLNDWLLEGIIGDGQTLDCNPPGGPGAPPLVTVPACVPPTGCDECQGKVSSLTLRYDGPGGTVMVEQKNGAVVFGPKALATGDVFSFVGTDNGTLGKEVEIFVDGSSHVKIHTSCSKPIGPGLTFGDFFVAAGASSEGGLLCDQNGGGGDCDPLAIQSLEIKDNEVKWKIKNQGSDDIFVSKVIVGWPAGKGAIDKLELNGTFHDPDLANPGSWDPMTGVPVVMIDSNFDPDKDKRKLEKGKTKDLKLKFKKKFKGGDYFVRVEFGDVVCALETDSTSPPGGPFVCKDAKPIDSLTMIWDGGGTVGVIAYDGDAGGTALGMGNVSDGAEFTASGMGGSPNDQQWEIYGGGLGGPLLGVSEFHISCSDGDMNGPEDCGTPQGNGKGDDPGLINDWLFEGMAGSLALDCTP